MQAYVSERSSDAQHPPVLRILEPSLAVAVLVGVASLTLLVERASSIARTSWAVGTRWLQDESA